MSQNEKIQEAVLLLSSTSLLDSLENDIITGLKIFIKHMNRVIVYVQCFDKDNMQSTTPLRHFLPKEGKVWEAYKSRKRTTHDLVTSSDPLHGLLSSCDNLVDKKKSRLMICPVVDSAINSIVSLLVLECEQLSKDEITNLNFFEKQILVSYKRLLKAEVAMNQQNSKEPTNHKVINDILNFCGELNGLDSLSLQMKLNKFVMQELECDMSAIFFLDNEHKETFYQCYAENKLQKEYRLPITSKRSCISTKFAGNTQTYYYLKDFSDEHRAELEDLLKMKVNNLMVVKLDTKDPDLHYTSLTSMFVCANKINPTSTFTTKDIDMLGLIFKYISPILYSTVSLHHEILMKCQTQSLLSLARNLFRHIDDRKRLLKYIMDNAKDIIDAERCSVFLLEDDELVSKVFDGDSNKTKEIRIPKNQGIAGYVYNSGEILNIENAYEHKLFYRGIDEITGFVTRNILCFPIKDRDGEKIMGIAQLCNKINGPCFTKSDVDMAKTFSVYCCISLVNNHLYTTVKESQQRNKVSNELMLYHMRVHVSEVDIMVATPIPTPDYFGNFSDFSFKPRSIDEDITPLAVICMFEDMGFIKRYKINKAHLCRFILMVKRGYRNPPYHNWMHAFAVSHFCYVLYKSIPLSTQYLNDIDMLALFVSCLCHDLDHRGTTSSYHIASDSALAAIYSSSGSVLERHHHTQAMCILNTEGCNIFDSFNTGETYHILMSLMYDIILATDLAHHLANERNIKDMIKEGYKKENKEHNKLLLSLLVTCCDLSDQTKDWYTAKKISELLYKEFFHQGDLEKKRGINPNIMMDRDKACIPDLQIGFLKGIAIPVYQLLSEVFPQTKNILNVIAVNKEMWMRMNKFLESSLHITNSAIEEMLEEKNDEIADITDISISSFTLMKD